MRLLCYGGLIDLFSFSALIGRNPYTVKRWCKAGKLPFSGYIRYNQVIVTDLPEKAFEVAVYGVLRADQYRFTVNEEGIISPSGNTLP